MSTKSRRPLATPLGMQTPKRKGVKSKSAQAAILDNFDLEGESACLPPSPSPWLGPRIRS